MSSRMLSVVPHRRVWYLCSSILVVASLVVVLLWRFNFGIDFTGGSLFEVAYRGERPSVASVAERATALGAERVKVQTAGDRSVIIRTAALTRELQQSFVTAFGIDGDVVRTESIGPSIGRELARKTTIGVLLALALIVCYVAWVFRKAGAAVTSWTYGSVALIAMAHDVIVPMGLFAVLGRFANIEVDAPFIAAVLTILGYSINDTIIVLDRVRENVLTRKGQPFADIVEASVRQSFARSMNTTLTTLLALLAVILLGGASVRYFALALLVGIGVGAYSSIFIAAPLLVTWQVRRTRS